MKHVPAFGVIYVFITILVAIGIFSTSINAQNTTLGVQSNLNGCPTANLPQNPTRTEMLIVINYTFYINPKCGVFVLNYYGQGNLNKYNINLNLTTLNNTLVLNRTLENIQTGNDVVSQGRILNVSGVLARISRSIDLLYHLILHQILLTL